MENNVECFVDLIAEFHVSAVHRTGSLSWPRSDAQVQIISVLQPQFLLILDTGCFRVALACFARSSFYRFA